MNKNAIEVRGLGKEYRISHQTVRATTLGEALVRRLTNPFSRQTNETFKALDDVSFEVERGEVLGVVGRNGAGKSTLLKILSRITEPSYGEARMKGRVGSLLEVGTGFHPELTGRENIYLNGAILGMRRKEIDDQFDAIVEFAEIEKFLDTPVKRYSSGMYVRLAFAVAAHLNPEILIVDEVLSVGDSQFQKKCLGKMQDVSRQEGRTVLFVSHNEAAVRALCHRCLLLNRGEMQAIGDPISVFRAYRGDAKNRSFSDAGRVVRPESVIFKNAFWTVDGVRTDEIVPSHRATLVLELDVEADQRFSIEFLIRDANGVAVVFVPCGLIYERTHLLPRGSHRLELYVDVPIMAAGMYSVDLCSCIAGKHTFDRIEGALHFSVVPAHFGSEGWQFHQNNGDGYVTMNLVDIRTEQLDCQKVVG